MASGPDDSAVRSTLGSYRLLGEVGRDPLGVLHLACPAGAVTFPKWAVVRRLHPGLARDPAMVHAFLAATQAAVRMVHPNIVSTFDFGGKMTLPWVAREHVLGVTMPELVAHLAAGNEKLPWALAVRIVVYAADGVAAVRARLPSYGPAMGFLTGVVTPSVFVTEDGEVKIVDGCLPLIEGLPLVDSAALPYRPRGPAPGSVNAGRADAFGLGVILWELLAGRRLFVGQTDDETNRLVDANVVPPLRTSARVPAFVDEVIQRALGRLPTHPAGFASASEVADVLRSGAATEGGIAAARDVAEMVGLGFAKLLTEQRALLADAWLKEQAMQASGDAPADVTSEAELTIPVGETVRDTTTETAISRRSGSGLFGEGFDEVPTIPRSRGLTPPSWRPEAPVNPPSLHTVPSIAYLPDTGSPPPPPSAPRPAFGQAEALAFPPLPPTPPPPPRSLVLPPVDRGPTMPPSAPRGPRNAPVAEQPSLLVVAAIGFGLALAVVLAVALYRDPAPALTPSPRASASVSAAPRAVPFPSARRSNDPWTPLPRGPIPVTSPDDLPRAPDGPAGVISHRPSPVRANAHVGLLTVFCNPACDDVTDGARSLGPSPVFKVAASVGQHRLRLRVDALSITKTVNVTIRENDTTVVRENLGP